MARFEVHSHWTNPNPNTIWNRLAEKLGHQPTDQEAADEVRRVLRGDDNGR